jgi:hypothetical protein
MTNVLTPIMGHCAVVHIHESEREDEKDGVNPHKRPMAIERKMYIIVVYMIYIDKFNILHKIKIEN